MTLGRSPAARARSARHLARREPRRDTADKAHHRTKPGRSSSATTSSAAQTSKNVGSASATDKAGVTIAPVPHPALDAAASPSKTTAATSSAGNASKSPAGHAPSSSAKAPAKGSSTKKPAAKSTTSHPSATATPQLGGGSASSHTAIVAGSVAGAVVVIALIVFFVRRHFVNRSAATIRRGQYEKDATATKENRSQLLPLLSEKKPASAFGKDDIPFSPVSPPTPARPASVYSATPSSIAPSSALLGPMMTPQSPQSLPHPGPPMAPTPQPPMSPLREVAIVTRNFVGTMPDELAVTVGEPLSIIATYDDGWAMCSSAYGQHGVVPLDCLSSESDYRRSMHAQDGGAWRLSRRASSLYPPAPIGMY